MNNKGQAVGGIILVAIAAIVCLIMITAVAQNVGQTTELGKVWNQSFDNTNRTSMNTLTGKVATNVIVTNKTTGATVSATNYTIYNSRILADGTIGSEIAFKDDNLSAKGANVSYTYQPLGYADEAGSRSIAGIIILLAAIGIAVVAIPSLKELFD